MYIKFHLAKQNKLKLSPECFIFHNYCQVIHVHVIFSLTVISSLKGLSTL